MTSLNVADLSYSSYHSFPNTTPEHNDDFTQQWHEFKIKPHIAVEIGLLYSQTPTNNNFHFLIIVESTAASAAARR